MYVLLLFSSYKVFILTLFLASNLLIFGGLYFAASTMSDQFFFKFAWNWFSGYNDESFFHVCVSFGLSPGFKLNGNS